ncbi:hypothetical protein Zm00014a_020958 [Zea mays]|uniref:Uncharacterized protein n=1 Tax=Zea mays TaxID=4577 RepID=A0A3L6E1U4_MAIZE|nr:hypothetical protein Zm00014a_020958 [Zea mays]
MVIVKNLYSGYIFSPPCYPECPCILCGLYFHPTVDDDDGVIFEDDADENEGYLFAGQYEDTDEDIEIDGSQDELTATDVPDPYDKVYSNIPKETHAQDCYQLRLLHREEV